MSGEAERMFQGAFSVPRDPRSQEYKAGVKAVLKYRFEGIRIRNPYRPGTAQSDAFYSGVNEGHLIYRRAEDKKKLAGAQARHQQAKRVA